MIAARVTCLCRQMCLPGLDLSLRQGEVGWVSEKEARASNELKWYIRQGALKVEYTERIVEMSVYPTWSRGNKVLPQRGTPSPTNPAMVSGEEGVTLVAEMQQALLHELRVTRVAQAQAQAALLEEVKSLRQAQERLASRPLQVSVPAQSPSGEETGDSKLLRGILRELIPLRQTCEQATHAIKESPATVESSVNTQLLEEIQGLRQVCELLVTAIQTLSAQQKTLPASMLGSVSGDSRKKDGLEGWGDEEPVFIPSGLVNTSQAVLVESAQDSESADVENSVAQLRALKSSNLKI